MPHFNTVSLHFLVKMLLITKSQIPTFAFVKLFVTTLRNYFTRPLTSFLFDVNPISLSKLLQNCVHSIHFQSKRFAFRLHKSSKTIKISFVKMSFAKIKLVHFNLHIIAFHIFPRFSCLNVMYLTIKSKKQKFRTCEMVQD